MLRTTRMSLSKHIIDGYTVTALTRRSFTDSRRTPVAFTSRLNHVLLHQPSRQMWQRGRVDDGHGVNPPTPARGTAKPTVSSPVQVLTGALLFRTS